MPDPSTLPVRVSALRYEAEDVVSVELNALDDAPLPSWQPGDHIDLHLRPGLIRQYSLCGASSDHRRYLIAVKREPRSRGGSEYVHTTLRPGDTITIAPPRSKFPLTESSHPAILIAAGIGITPITSMAKALQLQGKPFSLNYFARSPAHVVFADEWADQDFSEHVRILLGLDSEGVRTELDKLARNSDISSHLYVCGPGGFMTTTLSCFKDAGFADAQLHFEKFAPDDTMADRTPTGQPQGSFVVRAQHSGVETEVREDESIVEALARCGLEVPVSCEQGICGTCVSGVLSGTPDHRDDYLTDDEKAADSQMCVCVSRSTSDVLVLDL
ncbi:PDR/VanB family oxidoreductase [Rhodococcus sp. JVH1]|uniref:PDR/VanB family oxidoreductase n=1 Tax=Rhodococcus sp. JVH1 TaxID=745408 RepID=UPI00027203A9|nr:PDR/VanB family oxidoreductase [Rhodococcus sp. JVH1]EJI95935.1 vanillate O-demethylase oxidoreductase [Rhodococcus sp. JVH1]